MDGGGVAVGKLGGCAGAWLMARGNKKARQMTKRGHDLEAIEFEMGVKRQGNGRSYLLNAEGMRIEVGVMWREKGSLHSDIDCQLSMPPTIINSFLST